MQLQSKHTTGLEIPTFPAFSPLSVISRETYEKYIRSYEPYSDFGYTSLCVWGRGQEHLVSRLHGNIVLSIHGYMDSKKILTLIGNNDVGATVSDLFGYIDQQKGSYKAGLYLVPEVTARALNTPALEISEDRDNYDYILSTLNFFDLLGPGYSHMRQNISIFERRYRQRYEVKKINLMDNQVQQKIIKLCYDWAFMGTEGSITAHEEISAIMRLLKDLPGLNINGIIHALSIMIDDELQGFCIYEISGNYATTHFLKVNLDFVGAADYLLRSAMQQIYNEQGVLYVNHEQDLGIRGLRAAKMHYCPTYFLKKYTINRA